MTGSREVNDLVVAVGLPPATLHRADVEGRVGMSHDELVRWWRAMGFAEVPEEELAFGEDDVDMATSLAELLESGTVEDRDVLRLARVLGASFFRIAEAQVDLFDRPELIAPAGSDAGTGPGPTAVDARHGAPASIVVEPELLRMFEASLVYVWRRHLLAALGRRLDLDAVDASSEHPVGHGDGTDPETRDDLSDTEEVAPDHMADSLTVGFADIVGFSKMSKTMSGDALADLVDAFEAAALEVVGSNGGRVVKFIGDAVMFVAADLATGVGIGLDLQDRAARADPPISLHCGVAHGPGVTMGGDVFGPTVNLASRLTDVARKGTVVVPRSCAAELDGVAHLAVRPVRRAFDLKGIGRTRLLTVSRSDDDGDGEESEADQRERDRNERRERKDRERSERRERKEREREERERDRDEERERDRDEARDRDEVERDAHGPDAPFPAVEEGPADT